MNVQVQTDYTNKPFILSGNSFTKETETIKQDAGRSAILYRYTVMGKQRFSVATTGTADAGNTGDGTVTAVAKIAQAPFALVTGDYVLTVTGTATNGGTFKLEDPHGNLVASGLVMTAGAGAATVFNAGGLTFTITDGATDFAADDFFTITVTADGDWVPLDGDNINGGSKVEGIYMGDNIAAATLVAGDVPYNSMLMGGCCTVDSSQVVLENSLTLTSVLPSGLTVAEELAQLGIYVESTIDIDELEA